MIKFLQAPETAKTQKDRRPSGIRIETPRLVRMVRVLAMLCCLVLPFAAHAQLNTAKSIDGKVLNSGATALPGAIVYLQDEKTNVIRTFIAAADGAYRFGQLPASTDYQVWAEFKGKKSKVKLISSFDTKREIIYDFHIAE